jgi:hypothetical protein
MSLIFYLFRRLLVHATQRPLALAVIELNKNNRHSSKLILNNKKAVKKEKNRRRNHTVVDCRSSGKQLQYINKKNHP